MDSAFTRKSLSRLPAKQPSRANRALSPGTALPQGELLRGARLKRPQQTLPQIDGLPYALACAGDIAASGFRRWLLYSHPAYPRAQSTYMLRATCGEPANSDKQRAAIKELLDQRYPSAHAHEGSFVNLLQFAQKSNWGIILSVPCYRAFRDQRGRTMLAPLGERDGHFAHFLRCALAGVDTNRVFIFPTNSGDGQLFRAETFTESRVGGFVREQLAFNLTGLGLSLRERTVALAGGAVGVCLRHTVEFLGSGPDYKILPHGCYSNSFEAPLHLGQFVQDPWSFRARGETIDPVLRDELQELSRLLSQLKSGDSRLSN